MSSPSPDDWRAERRREAALRRRRRRRTLTLTTLAVVLVGLIAVGFAVLSRDGSSGAGGRSTAAVPTPQGGGSGVRTASTGSTVARAQATTPAPARTAPAAAHPVLRLPGSPARAQVTVPVLMYHRVAPAATATNDVSRDLTVTPQAFRAQMAWLARNHYQPISQAQLFRAMFTGAALPSRPVVITFDDGYVDAVDAVLPVLEPRRWPATFFIITGRVGQAAFLTWPQLQRLDRAGMDIGSHTTDHAELPGLDDAGRAAQLTASRTVLERRLGHPVYWFCYPAGRYDDASARSVGDAGYLLAFTTQPGSGLRSSEHLLLPRVRVRGEGSLDEFAQTVRAASTG